MEAHHRKLVLIATLTGQFATTFPITLFSVVLAPIARSYGVSTSFLTWAITGPFLVQAVCTPVFGKLGDTFGQRRLFLMGLAGSTVAALATAGAPTASALIGLRIVGPGVRSRIPADRPGADHARVSRGPANEGDRLVVDGRRGRSGNRPHHRRPARRRVRLAFTLYRSGGDHGRGAAAGPAYSSSDRETHRTPVDFVGACLLMAGVLAILVPMNQLPASGLSVSLVVTFVTGVVLLALFARSELRIAHPLIRMTFFRNPTFCLAIGIAFCMMFGYFGGFVLTPVYLETALGVTVSVTSLIMIGRPLAMSVSSPLWVRLPGSWPRSGPIFGGVLSVISMCVFAFGAWNHLLVAFIVGNVLGGLALGVANPGLTARLISSVAPEDYGSAAGVQVMFTQIASVLGLSVLAGVANRGKAGGHAPSYTEAYLIGAVVALGAISLAVYLNSRVPETSRQPQPERATQGS